MPHMCRVGAFSMSTRKQRHPRKTRPKLDWVDPTVVIGEGGQYREWLGVPLLGGLDTVFEIAEKLQTKCNNLSTRLEEQTAVNTKLSDDCNPQRSAAAPIGAEYAPQKQVCTSADIAWLKMCHGPHEPASTHARTHARTHAGCRAATAS